mgnify:FL=1
MGATSEDEASPSKRETQLSPHMRSGKDARDAIHSGSSCVKRSVSLPERCLHEACKPAVKTWEVSAPTSDGLKTRLATLREEDVPQKVRIRVGRTLRESVLTGHGERTIVRSPSPRLRGEAALATGQRAKASDGIPWHSPVYSKGALCHTLVTSPPDTRRVRTLGEFSEKLNGSTTKELVYPEEVPEGKQDNQFQSWLLSVQTCLKSISQTPQFPARSSSRAGSPTLMEKQQLCKPLKKYLESDASTKDACPFARNDSDSAARDTLAPTVQVRVRVQVPRTRIAPELAPADIIQERSRRWQFDQDMERIKNDVAAGNRSQRSSPGVAVPKISLNGAIQKEEYGLKAGACSSASQSTLEPEQSTRTPLSPMSPLVSSQYFAEALRPRWR